MCSTKKSLLPFNSFPPKRTGTLHAPPNPSEPSDDPEGGVSLTAVGQGDSGLRRSNCTPPRGTQPSHPSLDTCPAFLSVFKGCSLPSELNNGPAESHELKNCLFQSNRFLQCIQLVALHSFISSINMLIGLLSSFFNRSKRF